MLLLVEFKAPGPRSLVDALNGRARSAFERASAVEKENTWAEALARVYFVVDAPDADVLRDELRRVELPGLDVSSVRLVGAPAESVGPKPSHLVEWDLPKNLGMDQYLKRKAEKTPLYAEVPEVKFLRTYVREDMAKCVCLYDAPDEDAVRRAREVVSAPVDRLARVTSDDDE
ncbi:MAG TPA: DUF4242 domain-containing protein [Polyangiaceae bacterium]|nr:DUF4242 domain-containing protein [Polyangiaceae bacterium]